jgi:hypothetical protein
MSNKTLDSWMQEQIASAVNMSRGIRNFTPNSYENGYVQGYRDGVKDALGQFGRALGEAMTAPERAKNTPPS